MFKLNAPSFMSLSNKKRGNIYTHYKNKIRYEKIKSGRNFITYDYIEEDARCSWADFLFLSKNKKKIFYNAYIHIAQDELVSNASNIIMDEMYPLFEKYIGYDFKFEVSKRDAWGKPVLYKMDTSANEKIHEELGNKTFWDYQDDKITEYLEQNKPKVFEEFKLNFSYANGIGLEIIVDEEIITANVVEKAIQRFYDLGEVNWKAEVPVSEDKLVYVKDWYRIKKVSMSNAIVGISFDEDGKIRKDK